MIQRSVHSRRGNHRSKTKGKLGTIVRQYGNTETQVTGREVVLERGFLWSSQVGEE